MKPCGRSSNKGCKWSTIHNLATKGEDEVGNVCWFHCLLPLMRDLDGFIAIPKGTTVKLKRIP